MSRLIPALPFSDNEIETNYRIKTLANTVERLIPIIHEFDSGDKAIPFESKEHAVKLNDLKIIVVSHTPLYLERDDQTGFFLWIPIVGRSRTRENNTVFNYDAGENGFIGIPAKRVLKTDTRCAAGLEFNPDRLNRTIRAMSGDQTIQSLRLDEHRLLNLEYQALSFTTLFKNIFSQIDACTKQAHAMNMFALDDSLYRIIGALIQPSILFGTTKITTYGERDKITRICEFMKADMTQPISMSELEEMSGLSARALQYAFKKRFGLSPKQWIQNERLHQAHDRIRSKDNHAQITSISYDLGFSSPSVFAQKYAELFKELPSETRAKARKTK
jgi:AraC-like DNA-binding protein